MKNAHEKNIGKDSFKQENEKSASNFLDWH